LSAVPESFDNDAYRANVDDLLMGLPETLWWWQSHSVISKQASLYLISCCKEIYVVLDSQRDARLFIYTKFFFN
jgi:hypothetical protein